MDNFHDQLFENDKSSILAELNRILPSVGVCARQIHPGDICWRCIDCENDTTSIICSQCFEKSDHTGHQVQLKREASGLCDCGDPDAWKPQGFCKDHQGQNTQDSELILKDLSPDFKLKAHRLFGQIIKNYCEICIKLSSSMLGSLFHFKIKEILDFLLARIKESPSFIYIIEYHMCKITMKPQHHVCCDRLFVESDIEQIQQYNEVFLTNSEPKCSCSALDLSMQINHLLDAPTKKVMMDFCVTMFQSYHFKQCLTLSYVSNYDVIMQNNSEDENRIQSIGVQIMTSDEMSILIFKNQKLRLNILSSLSKNLDKIQENLETSKKNLHQIFHTIYHLKYMARPQSLKYCIANTDFIEQIICLIPKFYLADIKKPRDTMIDYVQKGQVNGDLLNRELQFIDIFQLYLAKLDVNDTEKQKSIFRAFFSSFQLIANRIQSENLEECGMINMPLHRCFGYYLTRLFFDAEKDPNLTLQENYRKILGRFTDQQDQLLIFVSYTAIKHISLIHEIISRKWVYYGYYFEHYPKIYYKFLSYQDLSLFQILMCCDNLISEDSCSDEISSKPLIESIISNFYVDPQFMFFVQQISKNENLKVFETLKNLDCQKLKIQLIYFLRFFAQLCVIEVSFLKNLDKQKYGDLWQKGCVREAAHLLIQNKVNTSIGEIKKKLNHIFVNDKLFEECLFKVSNQSRDIRGQMTFKIKDEYLKKFDPMIYYNPEEHSEMFKVYEHLKKEPEINIIIGDYKDNYQFVTDVNAQIAKNLSQSSLVGIVIGLLNHWLTVKIEPLNFVFDPRVHTNIHQIHRGFDEIKEKYKTISKNKYIEEIVDSNVGHHCLKLLMIFLKSFLANKMRKRDVKNLLKEITPELLFNLLNLRQNPESNCSETPEKMHEILSYILEQIYKIFPAEFAFLAEKLGLENQKIPVQEDKKKSNLKAKQNKLMAKMKNKGQKYLKKSDQPIEVLKTEAEEQLQCPFCLEDLKESTFADRPYGNFCYIQSSKFVFHAQLQTIRSSRLSQPSPCDDEPLESSGTYLTRCKHFAHFSCLSSFLEQKATTRAERYQSEMQAFQKGEFACLVCNAINNAMVPQCRGEVYIEYIGQVLQIEKFGYREMVSNTENVLERYVEYVVHNLNMVDYRGLKEVMVKDMQNMHFSMKQMLDYVYKSEQKFEWSQYLQNKELEVQLPEVNTLEDCIKYMLLTSFVGGEEKHKEFYSTKLIEQLSIVRNHYDEEFHLGPMRKLYAAVQILRDGNIDKVLQAKSNGEELALIYQELGIEMSQIEPKEGMMTYDLVLMTPYHQFSFYQIPDNFLDLQTQFYKRKCSYCRKEVLDSATCLLCGETICWFLLKNSRNDSIKQCRTEGQSEHEGLLTHHTRQHGCGIFLHTSTGHIVMIKNGASAIFDSPYRNQYGELSSDHTEKRYQDFKIDSVGGGKEAMEQYTRYYQEFQVRNAIHQQRMNPQTKYKIFAINKM